MEIDNNILKQLPLDNRKFYDQSNYWRASTPLVIEDLKKDVRKERKGEEQWNRLPENGALLLIGWFEYCYNMLIIVSKLYKLLVKRQLTIVWCLVGVFRF